MKRNTNWKTSARRKGGSCRGSLAALSELPSPLCQSCPRQAEKAQGWHRHDVDKTAGGFGSMAECTVKDRSANDVPNIGAYLQIGLLHRGSYSESPSHVSCLPLAYCQYHNHSKQLDLAVLRQFKKPLCSMKYTELGNGPDRWKRVSSAMASPIMASSPLRTSPAEPTRRLHARQSGSIGTLPKHVKATVISIWTCQPASQAANSCLCDVWATEGP